MTSNRLSIVKNKLTKKTGCSNPNDFSKKKIVFLGDSFTEGFGIPNIQNRFPERSIKNISPCYEPFIMARGGLNTMDQLRLLKALTFKPDVIVYQYYGNDIDGNAIEMGFLRKPIEAYKELSAVSRTFIKASYLLNYLYWLYPKEYLNDYSRYLKSCYTNDAIFHAHRLTITELLHYAQQNNAKVFCIVIPYLQDLESSQNLYVNQVENCITQEISEGQLIDIFGEVQQLSPQDRIVNSNDPHASEKVHQIIATKLALELDKLCR